MMDTTKWRKLTKKQVGEFLARDFLGEDVWIRWKQNMDELLSYRKSIKGKPTPEQLFILELNKGAIKFYNHVLYSGNAE